MSVQAWTAKFGRIFSACFVEREHGFHGFGEVGFGEVIGLEGVGD